MKLLMLAAVTAALALAASGSFKAHTTSLPYYDDPTFTPRWTAVEHGVAPFAMLTQTGATVSDDTLRGRIHVASFVYTKCAAVCPVLVRNLSRVQEATRNMPDVTLVSFSVTPDTDTPAALAAFGRERDITPGRWLLVTGTKRQVWQLARQSYFADDPRMNQDVSPDQAFLHTEKVVLVDQSLHLRGVYNGTIPFDMDRLVEDIHTLRGR